MATNLENLIGSFTLAELSARSGKGIAEIVEFALGGGSPWPSIADGKRQPIASTEGAGTRKAATGRRSRTRTGELNVRTAEGRAAYDDAVLQALRGVRGPTGAAELQVEVGGDANQLRASLHRLIEAEAVLRTGTARGTRYQVA